MAKQFTPVSLPPSVWSVNNDDEIDYDYPVTMASVGYYTEDPLTLPPGAHDIPFENFTPTSKTVTHEALVWKGSDITLENDERKAIKLAVCQSAWKCPMFITKCLYLGSHWLGLGNLFDPSEREDRKLLTNCFLEAISLDHTMLQDMTKSGQQSSLRWDTIRLTVHFFHASPLLAPNRCEQFSSYVENRLSEFRKIVRGCILSETGFSGNTDKERDLRVKELFELFISTNQEDIERAILQIVREHMFKELLWVSSLQTLNGLADGNRKGRITDLFPEEFREENILAKCLVGTLVTVFREFQDTMRNVLFLRFANVLPMDPKALGPRTSMNNKRIRTLKDVKPIIQVDECLPGLPYASFTSFHSERVGKPLSVNPSMGQLPMKGRKVLRPNQSAITTPVTTQRLTTIKAKLVDVRNKATNTVKSALRCSMSESLCLTCWGNDYTFLELPSLCYTIAYIATTLTHRAMTTTIKTAAMDSQELLMRSVPIWPMQLWRYTEITLPEALHHNYTVGMMQVDMPRCETRQDWTKIVHLSGAVYNYNARWKTYAEMNMRTYSDDQLMRLEAWIDASRKKLNNEEWFLVVEPMLVRGNEIFPYYYVVPEKRIITWLEPVGGYLHFQECKTAWHWTHKRLELEAQYW
ncbi:uncharacterized protein F5891DRAFT_986284 [Suillus fuscotomentosus]|uniref:Uncharacterized protein n=1 Tax=Suillus fuscotomentosus TaxID=1912939 RepID=A0AAD4DS59_9AGAM|nr:uncharacterized protein F5891DRAFT_986284 [Suillus fuscotomentosus]KAG1892960.1 hypothetical protein F5891DRAFT_986284 [Suillus fuscotomentosus]